MMTKSDYLNEDRPMTGKTAAIAFLLGIVAALAIFSAVELVAWVIFVDDFVWDSAQGRRVVLVFSVTLVIGAAAVAGLMRLKPWAGPISPTTRKTNVLFYLSALVAAPGAVVLHFAAVSPEHPFGFYSNSALPPGVAVFVITSWLLALAIAWWWYFSADEHERRAYDFGSLFANGLFVTLTPAWWIAARAGLLPKPDAMVIWCVMATVVTIGWFWHRYR